MDPPVVDLTAPEAEAEGSAIFDAYVDAVNPTS
jgi:hypothetical protein